MNDDIGSTTLGRFVEVLRVGEPMTHEHLTIVPLGGNGVLHLDYGLGADAIAAGTLKVTEVDEAGRVSELLAVSTAEQPVLLLEGEVLLGAKQHRVLNTSVLVPEKASVTIPVSCVEHGRWRHTSLSFSPGHHSPSTLRARKSRDVGRSLRTSGTPTSDQRAVWNEVAACLDSTGTTSPTGALSDAHAQRQESIEQYFRALSYPAGARGVVVAVGGRFAALDLFDKPETLRSVWPRLVRGYVLDAIGVRVPGRETFTAEGARELLERLAQVPCQPCPTVGMGEDWRFESKGAVGQALVADGQCIHLSAFPNGDAQDLEPPRPTIRPPSSRRPRERRRRDDSPDMCS